MKILLVNPPDDMETMLGAGAKLITPFEVHWDTPSDSVGHQAQGSK